MGKLEDVLSGGGFPSAMPDVPALTGPQQMAGAARILASTGFARCEVRHLLSTQPDVLH